MPVVLSCASPYFNYMLKKGSCYIWVKKTNIPKFIQNLLNYASKLNLITIRRLEVKFIIPI